MFGFYDDAIAVGVCSSNYHKNFQDKFLKSR